MICARWTSLLLLAAVTGCGDHPPAAPHAPDADVPSFARVEGPAQVEGTIGPGAFYGLYLPAVWNGDLVLYAHGYRDPDAPVQLPSGPDVEGLRDALLALGYGVALSSYSENGYAVQDGVIRTRQLRGLFASRFGPPERAYLMGHSLGGIVTLMSAEANPGLYAGALPMCSFLGGAPLEIDYIHDVRVLFDYFFPGVIPGDALEIPEGLAFGADVVPAVLAAISADPSAAVEMAGVDQIELPFTNPAELATSILSVLFFNVVGTPDLQERTRPFFDNMTRVYTGSSDDAALNAGVDRFEASPAGRNYLERWYLPDGDLRLPVLTLHTTMDPIVPFLHEAAYAGIVAAAGASDLLVQRAIHRYGHCAFTASEHLTAFLDLVTWVETGTAP